MARALRREAAEPGAQVAVRPAVAGREESVATAKEQPSG